LTVRHGHGNTAGHPRSSPAPQPPPHHFTASNNYLKG